MEIGNRNFFQVNGFSGANGTIRVTCGTLSTASLPAGGGSIYLNGGTLRWVGSFPSPLNSNESLVIGSNGGTLDGSGAASLSINSLPVTFENAGSSARLTLTGSGPATNVFTPGTGLNDPRTTASGGTSLVKTGTGTWTVGYGNNSYSGGTSILGGTLNLAGGSFNAGAPFSSTSGLGVGNVVVGDGAAQVGMLTATTPGISGTIALAGRSTVTINAGSIIAPGSMYVVGNQTASAPVFGEATLNLAPGADFNVNIVTLSGFDQVRLYGNLALNGADLVLTLAANVDPRNQQFIIVDNDGTDAIQGVLSNGNVAYATNNLGTFLFLIDYTGTDGNNLVLNGVALAPEPGTWAMLTLGMVGLLVWHTRRSARCHG